MKQKLHLFALCCLIAIVSGCARSDYYYYNDGEGYNGYYFYPYDEKYEDYGENPFFKTTRYPVSTFSVDADGASYANMRRFVNNFQRPPRASVRIEEYINYFTFDYDEPTNGENVAVNYEISTCPWNYEHHLLRVGLKGRTIPESELPSSNYVFLIDVSGSMNSADKLGVLKTGFKLMAEQLRDDDKVAIITYSGKEEIVLNATSGSEKAKIIQAIDKLRANGATAGARAIEMAYKVAQDNFIEGGNNRIILGTDGDFNVGVSSTEELVKLIEKKRESGVYMTVLGVGTGNLNDQMMEQLANKGNGTYEYIDNAKQIEKVFVHEKSKFHTIAKDCKIQVNFNPAMVDSYRLIGYENRALKKDDFVNDTKDAGEIGAAQTITAIYELILKNTNDAEKYATLDIRYKMPDQEQSRLISNDILTTPIDIYDASENMRFAASVTGFGLVMKQSRHLGAFSQRTLIELGDEATSFDPNGYRAEFIRLMRKVL